MAISLAEQSSNSAAKRIRGIYTFLPGWRFTIVQKIAIGYLLFGLFTLLALALALQSLHLQSRRTELLVKRDIKALDLARDLHATLLTQERLEKQHHLLREPALLDLVMQRQSEFADLWQQLATIPELPVTAQIAPLVDNYMQVAGQTVTKLQLPRLGAERFISEQIAPARDILRARLEGLVAEQEGRIADSLMALSADNARSLRITSFFAFLGVALAAPVALLVIFNIHRSVRELSRATREIAAGHFSTDINLGCSDEFGDLAREFAQMGKKMADLERRCLDANPLTRLPGNLAIDRALQARIAAGQPFAHIYIDLDNFKAYGDRYGYQAGSTAIVKVSELLRETVERCGLPDDLVGHIGGDDYLVFTTPEYAETIAKNLIAAFDQCVPELYSAEDQAAGFFVAEDRYGVQRQFPLMTMSVAIILSENIKVLTPVAFSTACTRIKEHLKALPGSNYLIDRRKLS
jgi:GGDEF domain-containing protein/CHASE3 domain sensor protein